jgi:hypothetical protein
MSNAGLEVLRDRVDRLGDSGRRRGLPLEADRDRILQHVAGERHDRLGHGGAEEQGLPLGRKVPEDAPDVGEEPHVEHPVRLIEHQNLEPTEAGIGLSHVIEQPARGRDDHIDAAPQGMLLRPHAHTAEDRRRCDWSVHREVLQVFLDLCGELTGWRDDERPRCPARLADQPVEDREQEGRRLAASSLGASEDVPAFDGGGKRFGLNRRGTGETELLDTAEETGMQLETGERH